MNRNIAFWRKIVYISAIAVLLIPLYMIGSPSRRADGDLKGGGGLAAMRSKYHLSQVGLGEIDPAGEAMRLACLGMRGVAANVLWTKANHYKMTEQFDEMAATVDQITKLQPNFIKVWEFHAHNLSFNTSVEYDDFRFRYHWVKRGLRFLMRGMRYNQDDTRLLWELGWFTEQKIGRSDEYVQFRKLFREDYDFHEVLRRHVNLNDALGPDLLPDSWLVGRQWYLMAEDLVDNKGVPVQGRSPLLFHSSPSLSLMYYAMAVEEEGHLGQIGQRAWMEAGDSWNKYGSREIPTSYGFLIRLNDLEEVQQQIDKLVADLDKLVPGGRERLRQEKYDKLDAKERAALEIPVEKRTADQDSLAYQTTSKLVVEHGEVADAATAANQAAARVLARRISDREWFAGVVSSYRDIVNFEYWRTRSTAEQSWTAIKARECVYRADQAFDNIDLVTARGLYEEAWKNWAEIFRQHPALLEDVSAEDVVAAVLRYSKCLDQLGESFPDPFILQSLLDLHRELRLGEHGDKLDRLTKQSEDAKPEQPANPAQIDAQEKAESANSAGSQAETGEKDGADEAEKIEPGKGAAPMDKPNEPDAEKATGNS